MARFRSLVSFYVDPPGPGRIRAGRTVSDNQAGAQAGDVVWPGAVAGPGLQPIDASGNAINDGIVRSATILGVHSVDG
jgi:hypothetical protein